MIKNFIAALPLVAGFLLLSATEAQAAEPCVGEWAELSGAEWGPPSTCSCFRDRQTFSGGVYVSDSLVGWAWSSGWGKVRVLLEAKRTVMRNGFPIEETRAEYAVRTADRRPFIAENGLGAEGPMTLFLGEGWTWTGRFRADCYPGE